MKKVEIAYKNRVFNGFLKIDEAELQFELHNGQMSPSVKRLVLERGDSVAALLWNTDTKKLILTKQFRYPTYEKGPGWLLEIAAGTVAKGEEPQDCMRREIEEELGYKVKKIHDISVFYLSPGGASERIFLYYAEVKNTDKVSQGGGVPQEVEDIEEVCLTKKEAWEACLAGQIPDAKTIIALQWMRLNKWR